MSWKLYNITAARRDYNGQESPDRLVVDFIGSNNDKTVLRISRGNREFNFEEVRSIVKKWSRVDDQLSNVASSAEVQLNEVES